MSNESVQLQRVSPSDGAPLLRSGFPRMPSCNDVSPYGFDTGNGIDETGGIPLREVWRIIRKRRWMIPCVAVIVTTLATIEAYRAKSMYSATAYIEIGQDSPNVGSSRDGMVIQFDDEMYYPELTINSNLFRLTSEPLLEVVVANLKLDQNSKFSEPSKISFLAALQELANRATFNEPAPEPQTEVGGLLSESDYKNVLSSKEHERLSPYVSMLAGGLKAQQVKASRTLKVTYTHTDPSLTAEVANGVAQTFINLSFENKAEKITGASKWLDTTTRDLKARVERADQDLADYTKTHNMFLSEGKDSLTSDKLTQLHDQVTRIETERILKQSIYEEVKAGRVSELPAAFADPMINALQRNLEQLEANLTTLGLTYQPAHKSIVAAREEINGARAQLVTSRKTLEAKMKGEYLLAVRDEQSLKATLDGAKAEAIARDQANIQLGMLTTDFDTAKSMYKDFLEKTNQSRVEVAQQYNNMRLIQPARVPGGPDGPNRLRTILYGVSFSLLGGVGLAFLLERIDNTIKSLEDVARYTQLPALGVIPKMATPIARNLRVADNRSSAAEAFRFVRTAMLMSAPGSPPKTVLVTSGQPGEGKSTTVVNTAISLAQLGSSVLIIDGDLRRPSTHRLLGVKPTDGLSSYLSRDIEIPPLIHKLQIPNLSLLPCGPIPPNPAELISSARMAALLKELGSHYDHILIDSPPIMNVADPVILSSLVDGVILVVHGGKSPRATVQRARQDLLGVGAKIVGVVLNNIDLRREGYDSSHYHYNRYYAGYESAGE